MKIGSSIFGGISASKAMKSVRKNMERQRKENQEWYDRRYNEDATQRPDAQRMLTKTSEAIRNRNRQAAGAAAMGGATEESVAATKAAGNEALADVASQIAVAGDARKDNIESQYRNMDQNLQAQINNMNIQRANAIAQAVGGVSSAAGDMGGSIDEYLAERKKGTGGKATAQ